MKKPLPSPDELYRLAKAMMQKHGVDYERALEMLAELRIHFICPRRVAEDYGYQAALLTAINTAKRAFLGGVTAFLESDAPCLLPGFRHLPLSKAVENVGAQLSVRSTKSDKTVWLGHADNPGAGDVTLVADGWRGGYVPSETPFFPFLSGPFTVGAVFAAGVTVARCFLDVSGLVPGCCDEAYGMSMWRPDVSWTAEGAAGPIVTCLPKQLWLLGLGHLGQAYLWTVGLLPYREDAGVQLYLHDYDRITAGNWSAGLLCERQHVNRYKTRICANWAEDRGFGTHIIERPFDKNTRIRPTEPRLALCGFDAAEGRRALELAGFDLVVECGLGSSAAHFDRLVMHTFPEASKHPEAIWPASTTADTNDFDPNLFGEIGEGECGVLLETLAKKPISASFVGAAASAVVVGELLRGLHGGPRYDLVRLHLRSDQSLGLVEIPERYERRFAANGFVRAAQT